ncbi:dihydrofolate reductase family protein [Salisediminibacterium selenitireducens]|uniref:Bifunctional deaminase-reductase domain protein n=1 Tax=Bacillus selenitireducens (strain ATCC 700615 / DSM 15326 / MLS10) TaxID=439292 RepID=D6XWJ9_BACIE|nr:dihydrofolate reductase family protein [Salisediminibacterium selenitireducens]ADH97841.1 bifunctional deaminase-reductase domain protein [[Bacillus] selenitireducens MLS10]
MPQTRNVTLFIAMSLDGCIATSDHSLDWLEQVEGEGDNGYEKFYSTVDTVLLGRKTYDWIRQLALPAFPYEGKSAFVFSRDHHPENDDVHWINEDPVSFVRSLKASDGGTIWLVGGGELVKTLYEAGLIDSYIITIAPVLLGNGIPLFLTNSRHQELELLNSERYGQFIQLYYKRKTRPD